MGRTRFRTVCGSFPWRRCATQTWSRNDRRGLGDARGGGGTTLLDRVIAVLAPRRALLVLDNVEQIPDAAPVIDTLLTACPGLTLLVTSRARLQVYGERDLPVGPLALESRADREQSAAVHLFVARAQAVKPDFAPGPRRSRLFPISAGGWMGYRSPLSWRPHGSACCRWRACGSGWTMPRMANWSC